MSSTGTRTTPRRGASSLSSPAAATKKQYAPHNSCEPYVIVPAKPSDLPRSESAATAQAEGARHIFAIESQTNVDHAKYESWPYYIAYLHAKFHCPVTLIVVTSKTATTRWARGPIEIGLEAYASMVVSPLVLGPDNVPAITNAETARRDITLAVFSALTHRHQAGVAVILEALVTALRSTDPDTAGVLIDFVEAGLGDTPAREHWRDMILKRSDPDASGHAR